MKVLIDTIENCKEARTFDIGGNATTSEFMSALLVRIEKEFGR